MPLASMMSATRCGCTAGRFRVVKRLPEAADKRILRDDLVVLKNPDSRANYVDLWDLLRFCGTAGGHFRYLATPQDAYFPGFA